MKKFFDEFFKPYLFAAFLIVLGSYLKVDKYLNALTSIFSDSTNSFINFFSKEISLWQIIIYFVFAYVVSRIYKILVLPTSKEERRMYRAIRKYPTTYNVTVGNDKYESRYKITVVDGEYFFDKFVLYCENCSEEPIRMSKYALTEFRCNCGRQINHNLTRDIKSRILTEVEKLEK